MKRIGKSMAWLAVIVMASLSAEDYLPEISSRPSGNNQIVATSYMTMDDGMFASIAFVVIDKADPESRNLDGLAALVMLDNLTNVKDHKLSLRTPVAISRDGQSLTLVRPKVVRLGEARKVLEFSAFKASELLALAKGKGKVTIAVDGKRYDLDDAWSRHVDELVREVELQRSLFGYK